jgi:hypothetical protein
LAHNKIEIIPSALFLDLLEHIKDPSTGIAFLYWLYRKRGKIDRDSIYGFAFFDKSIKHHYFNNRKKDLAHNGNAERELFDKMVEGTLW